MTSTTSPASAPTNASSTEPLTEPNAAPTYPVHLVIAQRPCLVVGAGKVAAQKARGLLAAGGQVTVVGPRVHDEIAALPVTVHQRPYRAGEVANYRLAIACTDDPAINHQVYTEGEAAGVWVNAADDPANCAWILPSVHRHGDLTITASTNGRSPAMASWLRRRFEAEFDDRYQQLLDLLAETRAEVRAHFGTSEVPGWREALDGPIFDLVVADDIAEARRRLRAAVGLPVDNLPSNNDPLDSGATQIVPTTDAAQAPLASPTGASGARVAEPALAGATR